MILLTLRLMIMKKWRQKLGYLHGVSSRQSEKPFCPSNKNEKDAQRPFRSDYTYVICDDDFLIWPAIFMHNLSFKLLN